MTSNLQTKEKETTYFIKSSLAGKESDSKSVKYLAAKIDENLKEKRSNS